ncbi:MULTISPECIES: alpha/beta fold hydrolase [Methylomonas]|uniref:Alpha/beta hydrolase n=1 Tax=Methylomonas koyamae TaxID=702114 RepID=A0A177NPL2_9GAMM|nr:alpha/beta hydrolase [Methylomonas koyamae]OAI19997.1 alpha/beta hydrolase [Methylomonas koyamae]
MGEAGRHWLLLRGLARETAHWGDFPLRLRSAFPASTVTCVDLPGTGSHFREACPTSIGSILELTRERAYRAGALERPVTLLALSLGGMVAWEWACRYPADVAAGCLINTSFSGVSPFYRRLRWQSYGALANILLEREIGRRERRILELVSNQTRNIEELSNVWLDIQSERPVNPSNAAKQLIAAARFRPKTPPDGMPWLVLSGLGDRLVAPACSSAVSQRWQLSNDSHPWAGHDLPLDDPDWLVNRLRTWIANQGTEAID